MLRITSAKIQFGALVSFLFALTLYFSFTKSILERDDVLYFEYILGIESLKDYFTNFLTGSNIDFQPIRDLFIYLQLKTSIKLQYYVYPWVSFLIYLSLFWQYQKFLTQKNIPLILALIIFLHPSLAHSLAWFSAQKHLLSVLFLLMAMNYKKLEVWFYILSILSQPITLLYPFFRIFKRKKILKNDLLFLFIMLVVGYLNILYFSYYATGDADITFLKSAQPQYVLAAVGRMGIQLLAPFNQAINYDPFSSINFLGLILIIIIFAFALKSSHKEYLFLFILLMYPLITTREKVFYSDTYLILPLLLLPLFINKKSYSVRMIQPYITFAVLCFFIFKFCSTYSFYQNNTQLFKRSYLNSPSHYNFIHYAQHEIKRSPKELFRFIKENNVPITNISNKEIGTLLGKLLMKVPLAPNLKILYYKKWYPKDCWYSLYGTFIFANAGKFREALDEFKKIEGKACSKLDASDQKNLEKICLKVNNRHPVCVKDARDPQSLLR